MALSFHTLDVFTDTALAGNPLAVVLDADELDEARMQAIASEFNLSETVFVQAPDNPAHTARLRIFTPTHEMPFAGHPTIGTAILLASLKYKARGERDAIVILEEQVGPIRCGVVLKPRQAGYAEFDVPQTAREIQTVGGDVPAGAALSLTDGEIGCDNHRPTVFSAGVPFTFVPVESRAALARVKPIAALWRQSGFSGNGGGAYVYTRETDDPGNAFAARMFTPERGIVEDPATGSAAAAFAGVVARFEALGDGLHTLSIEQGVDMGRPSLITLEIEMAGGRVVRSRVGGRAVAVSKGRLKV